MLNYVIYASKSYGAILCPFCVSVDYSMCGAIVGYQSDVRSRPLTVDGMFII